jgi:hypothetical protein
MLIQYLTGPLAGQTKHVKNEVGRFAIDAGLAEFVPIVKQPADIEPRWTVTYTPQNFAALVMQVLGRTETYTGLPELISKNTFGGHVPPPHIVGQYKQLYSVPANRDPLTAAEQAAKKRKPFAIDDSRNPNFQAAEDLRNANQAARERAAQFQPSPIMGDGIGASWQPEDPEVKSPLKPGSPELDDDELERLSVTPPKPLAG